MTFVYGFWLAIVTAGVCAAYKTDPILWVVVVPAVVSFLNEFIEMLRYRSAFLWFEVVAATLPGALLAEAIYLWRI